MDLSIIIPVYNTEKYLEKCLESVCNQDIKNKTYEIIIVNDGATDKSETIIKKYKKKYPQLIKYIKKENGGLSSARNAGLKIATGKYIYFIDSDDYIEHDLLTKFFKNNNDYDMFIFGYNEAYETKKIKNNIKQSKLIDSHKALPLFFENKAVRGYVWNKILKREIIQKNNLLFDESIKYIEDLPFIIGYLTKINKVYIYNEVLYNYVQRNGSLINSKFNINKLSALISYDQIINIINEYDKKYLANIYYFDFELNYELSVRIRISDEIYEKEYKLLRSNMKKYFKKFILRKARLNYKLKAVIKIIFYEKLIKKHGGK